MILIDEEAKVVEVMVLVVAIVEAEIRFANTTTAAVVAAVEVVVVVNDFLK